MSDAIKDAFTKIKQDIQALQTEIELIKIQTEEINRTLKQLLKPTDNPINPTIQQINPTDNLPNEAPIPSIMHVSSGNEGVPTNKQTNKQTDTQPVKSSPNPNKSPSSSPSIYSNQPNQKKTDEISRIEHLSNILDSLDSIKKDIRSKFKYLTNTEMLVFSTIYQLEEEGKKVDFPTISSKLSLSESSVREYVLKLIKKGVPIVKFKENNKKIFLSIMPELKKMATLETILKLREI